MRECRFLLLEGWLECEWMAPKNVGRFLGIFARFCLPSAGTFPQRVEMEKLLGIPMVKQEQQPVPDQSVN